MGGGSATRGCKVNTRKVDPLKACASAFGSLFLALCISAVVPSAAVAATAFSQQSPAPGAAIASSAFPVSVRVEDPAGINSVVTLTLDGVRLRATYSPFFKTVTAQAAGVSNGPHTLTLSVLSYSRARSTTSWSFTVGTPPRINDSAPANDIPATALRPEVFARVLLADGAGLAQSVLEIDGVTVPSTWNAGTGRIAWARDRDLADDTVHNARLWVRDTYGSTAEHTWTFAIQVYPDMQAMPCEGCHPAAALSHDTLSPTECLKCHNMPFTGDSSPIGDCIDCHPGTYHAADRLLPYSCETCHSTAWTGRIANHESSPAEYHLSSQDLTGCTCHSRSLTREHARRADGSDKQLDCMTCHASTDSAVVSAIAAGESACASCHVSSGHADLHGPSGLPAQCQTCHLENIAEEHTRQGIACAFCHSSVEPAVVAAIADGDTTCSVCHGATDHLLVHEAVVDPECLGCHEGNLVSEHEGPSLACSDCHESVRPAVQSAITSGDTGCAACHEVAGHRGAHDSEPAAGCLACHAVNLVDEHEARTLGCPDCHESVQVDVTAAIGSGITSCFACHDFGGHEYPAAAHTSSIAAQSLSGVYPVLGLTYGPTACTACHSVDLKSEHARPGSSAAVTGCSACHPAPRDSFGTWSGGCVQAGCHLAGSGTAMHRDMASGHVLLPSYAACESCHPGSDLAAVHLSNTGNRQVCVYCHTPSASPATRECVVCHPGFEGLHY